MLKIIPVFFRNFVDFLYLSPKNQYCGIEFSEEGMISLLRQRIKVDFPAPLRPMMPKNILLLDRKRYLIESCDDFVVMQ